MRCSRVSRRREPTPHSPWGLRLPPDTRVDDRDGISRRPVRGAGRGQPADRPRRAARRTARILDLCAGAGGKSLALAAAAPGAAILATDINRARLSRLAPRAERAGAPSRPACSARRANSTNLTIGGARPMSCWSMRLARAAAPGAVTRKAGGGLRRNGSTAWPKLQAHLLELAADLVRPGGALVYAVCSILSREGAGQVELFLSMRSSWISEEMPIAAGRSSGAGRLLTPAHDGTDGFFIARLGRPC